MSQRRQQRLMAATAAGLAALSSAIYADKKYAISSDLKSMRQSKVFLTAMAATLDRLGDNVSVYRILELADQDAEALWFEGRTWTFAQLKMEIDRLATLLYDQNTRENDVVGVFATNSPEMVITFGALAKIGAIPALLNTSLRSQTLAHCLNVVDAKTIIATPDLMSPLLDLFGETKKSLPIISINLSSFAPLQLNETSEHRNLVTQIRYEDLATVLPNELRPATAALRKITDSSCYIYTSGTSGKPKAVDMKSVAFVGVSTPNPVDTGNSQKYLPLRTYSCLPLFHATALLVAMHSSWGVNGCFCLGRRFSARNFSKELYNSKATRMVYVGELCRYLLKPAPSEYDKKHKVIVATGNGLAGDIWNKFRERYNIPEIREFYRSTEGIAGFDNFTSRSQDAGYVGHVGPLRRKYFEQTTYLVKYDRATEAPWRDPKTGFCVQTAPGEVGEAIGRVTSMATYRGYLNNAAANESKLIRDVFEKGDVFQRTGDLLVRDSWQWIKFADRTGDTYRWQGENVSAGEVKEHISKLPGVYDASVFGVKLDGYDGQAGAAGLILADTSPEAERAFMDQLYDRLRKRGLTAWQIPRLVRLTEKIEATATFKHVTSVLKERNWEPSKSQGDRLFWLDGDKFRRLDDSSWKAIQGATARL